VTGIYVNAFDPSLNISEGFPVFNTVIEANCVTKKADNLSAFNITGALLLQSAAFAAVGQHR